MTPADDRRIGAECVRQKLVAEHDDRRRALLRVSGHEGAAVQHAQPNSIEQPRAATAATLTR